MLCLGASGQAKDESRNTSRPHTRLSVREKVRLQYLNMPICNLHSHNLTFSALKVILCAAYLKQLHDAGAAETFLDSLFGTDCYSSALTQVGNECKSLGQSSKSRLALVLTGCHLKQLGQKHIPCREQMTLKQCADSLDDRGYSTYLKFLAEIDRSESRDTWSLP